MANETLSNAYLLEMCDYRFNYLGCSSETQYDFAISDLVMIVILSITGLGYLGLIIRNTLRKRGQKFNLSASDKLCFLIGTSDMFRIALLAHIRLTYTFDVTTMTASSIAQYVQTNIILDFINYAFAAISSNVFLVW